MYLASSLRSLAAKGLREGLTLILVDGLGELVDGGGHLESLHEDALLSLDADVLGPLDEAGQVASGLDVATNAEVLGGLLEERALGVSRLSVADHDLSLSSFLNLITRVSNSVYIRVNKSLPREVAAG
jgi:hypothetical protein